MEDTYGYSSTVLLFPSFFVQREVCVRMFGKLGYGGLSSMRIRADITLVFGTTSYCRLVNVIVYQQRN